MKTNGRTMHHLMIIAFALLLAACVASQTPEPTIGVSPIFMDFYNLKGGSEILGPAISDAFIIDGILYQYAQNALMLFDEKAASDSRFRFAPIGLEIGVVDNPLPVSLDQSGARLLNGHIIYPGFVEIFDQLGGVKFVGNPITDLRAVVETGYYVQYFENLAFFIDAKSDEKKVQLLAYGKHDCDARKLVVCGTAENTLFITNNPSQPFISIVDRLGLGFAGQPLTQPYLSPDGYIEQIYENVVIIVDPTNISASGVFLRGVPSRLGVLQRAPVPQRTEPNMVFYPVKDNLGYNVPQLFFDFIVLHGGYELSGPPVTELFEHDGLRRQCFTNYCLDYDPQAPESARVQPVALGYEYKKLLGFAVPNFRLVAWEVSPVLAPGAEQVVGVKLVDEISNQPLKDYQPTLSILQPDGITRELVFPPTSGSGTSYISVPSITQMGTYSYTICIATTGNEPVCQKESWLVK